MAGGFYILRYTLCDRVVSKNHTERARLLQQVTEHGFINDYSGVRISKTGKRFVIEQATVWNLIGTAGTICGQAATFSRWRYTR